jgi:hypothetical protein
MLSKKSADFFAFLVDISAEIRSLVPKNNPTLTMFPQKDFISAG